MRFLLNASKIRTECFWYKDRAFWVGKLLPENPFHIDFLLNWNIIIRGNMLKNPRLAKIGYLYGYKG